jgi:hypothetical protein
MLGLTRLFLALFLVVFGLEFVVGGLIGGDSLLRIGRDRREVADPPTRRI